MLGVQNRVALKDGQFQEVPDKDIEFEFTSPNQFLGTHSNLIPLQSAVQGGRIFYGARFANQALPVNNSEAPLVQLKADDDPQGRSFDEILGESAGAVRSKHEGVVHSITPDHVIIKTKAGEKVKHDLYSAFPYNRRTAITSTPAVKPGDKVTPGQLLAHSNFTDKHGTLALGINARTGLVPYLGRSMDDAIVVSEAFAKRLSSNHSYGYDLDYKRGIRGGKDHHTGLFPHTFINDQLDKLDDDGIVKPGQIVNDGDPIILASKPRVVSSSSAQLGLLSKHMKSARSDASVLWEHETPGKVVDVHRGRSGVKLNIQTDVPTQVGDKIIYRAGQKGVISTIIPDEHMPRTADGKPLEVLLNPLSIPSRVNPSMVYELLLGKVASKTGKTFKLPAFTKPGEKWHDIVRKELDQNGLTDTEEVFDPLLNKKLENPITVGNGYVEKLSHTSASKISARGQGSYDSSMEPLHGGGEGAESKRLSGLESGALMSSGAYAVLRDAATTRGTKNDAYWRELRQGYEPKEPGSSFVWDKFKALLQGSGYQARKLGKGVERLGFWTDRDLEDRKPLRVKTGDIVDLNDLSPIRGGLFDPALTGNQSWGSVALPCPLPNPAAEDLICKMLGLTKKQYRAVIAGEESLPDHLQHPK